MTPDEIHDLIDALYDATGAGDFATAETMLTDDFFIEEAEGLPFAGIYRGKTALRDLFAQVMQMMDVASLERFQTTVGGDYAVVILQFNFVDPDLRPAELCERFKIRDGKVCEIKPYYFDPGAVVAACNAKSRA